MRRSPIDLVALAGVFLMGLGAFGPWATAHPVGRADLVTVSGFDHGALLVLGLAVLAVVALLLRRRTALFLVALVALGWLTVTGYELPGSLQWAWGETDLAWGIGVAGLGAVVALGASLAPRRLSA
jgi:hypothetical protein